MSEERLRLLIVGGYGVFGGRLAQLLADEPRLTILVAGRSRQKAERLCRSIAGRAELIATPFDRDADIDSQLRALAPDIVVDASGPFQNYRADPYAIVRAAIGQRCHYLDLADASAFVAGVAAFDEDARAAGVYVLSGVSSFPVLTAAVVRHLTRDGVALETITGGIAPSPYAGVGRNVVKAIASYAGKPVSLTRNGRPSTGIGLAETMRYTIAPPGRLPLHNTLFSLIDVPDLRLLPAAWPKLRSIWIGAGPVPEILHRLLIWLTWAVRLRLLPSLAFAAPLFHRTINTLRWGEHRGGMFVDVVGQRADGRKIRRSWHLLAEGNDGPYIPSMAIEAVIRKHLEGSPPADGARSATRALELEDYRWVFADRTIYEGVRDDTEPEGHDPQPLFQQVLGEAWDRLPEPIQTVHKPGSRLVLKGQASVARGRNPLCWMIAQVFGFPPATDDTPVTVTITGDDAGEVWTRQFGKHRFKSHLTAGAGRSARLIEERFGPLSFAMALVWENDRLNFVVRRWRAFAIALPRVLAPGGETFECVDARGRFNFSVDIRLPLLGQLVGYRGYLEAVTVKATLPA